MEATRSLDDSNFGAISRGSGAFAADRLSSTHTGHTLEPAMQLPVGSRRHFCRSFISVSIEIQQRLCSVELHLSTPPFHHTSWALLSWQLDSTTIMATAYHAVYLACPDGHVYGQGASSHSPQGCLAWAWPAHLFDSLSALETGSRQ